MPAASRVASRTRITEYPTGMETTTRSTEFVALGHAGSDHYAGLESFPNPGVARVELDSDDPPQKVFEFYAPQVKKYGAVLNCRVQGGSHSGNYGRSGDSPTICEHGEATDITAALNGEGIELKSGTKDDQHMVVIKSQGSGTQYVLLKVQHGKRGESI